jgi:hypothetical protein
MEGDTGSAEKTVILVERIISNERTRQINQGSVVYDFRGERQRERERGGREMDRNEKRNHMKRKSEETGIVVLK